MSMKKEEIDKLITESLNEEEARFYNDLEEEGIVGMWKEVYTGKHGWIAILMSIVHTIIVGIAVYCGIKLFTVPEVTEILRYGTILFIALAFGSMIKLWHWLQMDKNSILREMKRIEFQVAVLMEKISDR